MVSGGEAVWSLTVHGYIAVWNNGWTDGAKTIFVGLALALQEGRRATVYESRWEVGGRWTGERIIHSKTMLCVFDPRYFYCA